MNFAEEIKRLRQEKNAVILAHYYTIPEVQEIADFVGDSLALSQKAAETDADIILFAGVHFMAETAKILNPNKKVLIPDLEAGCSLADNCDGAAFGEFLKNYPDHIVLSYINCSAAVKCLSDIIVTSGNALKIVNALPQNQKIVFAPDRNLGRYINEQTGRDMVLWDGVCYLHNAFTAEKVAEAKTAHPAAEVIAHPECTASVLAFADYIGSTAAMLKRVASSDKKEFIVITEHGILHELKKQNPDKTFHIINTAENCACSECSYMKLNTLEKIYLTLRDETPELLLDAATIEAARKPIVKMLEMSNPKKQS